MTRIALLLLACPLACSADAEQTPLLRVISYNVKGLDWTPGASDTYPEAVDLDDLLTTLRAHPAHVIGFQELRKKDQGPSLAEQLADALGGYHVFTVTTTSGWLPYVQQNAILSRYALSQTTDLDLGEDPGGTEHRRFHYAQIRLPGDVRVHLGNVHMFTDSTLQQPALEKIEAFLATRVGADDLLVWTGDFNFEPRADDPSSPYAYLTGRFAPRLVDPLALLQIPLEDPAQLTSSAADPRRRIDYIFTSPNVEALAYSTITEPVPDRTYPDHLAVQAELRLGTNDP